MANATAAAFALDIDVAIVADSAGTNADTAAILVSSVADVLAAARAIVLTDAIASKLVCVNTDTAAIAVLLLAILVAIVADTAEKSSRQVILEFVSLKHPATTNFAIVC